MRSRASGGPVYMLPWVGVPPAEVREPIKCPIAATIGHIGGESSDNSPRRKARVASHRPTAAGRRDASESERKVSLCRLPAACRWSGSAC